MLPPTMVEVLEVEMNPDLLLSASDKDLPRILDGILSGPFKHDIENHGTHHVKCKRCDKIIPLMDRWDIRERYPCWVSPFDDEIPLTWPEAMKWRDWAVENYGVAAYKDALISVIMPGEENAPNSVKLEMVLLATETDHLKASALCVKGNNDEKG